MPMKYLVIALLTLLLSCSDDSGYEDLSGTWEFSKGSISGTIELVKMNSTTFSSVEGTTFMIAGKEYTNKAFTSFHLDSEMRVFSISDGTYFIVFGGGTFNSSFTKMRYVSANWGTYCQTVDCEEHGTEMDIVFKRK